MKKIIANITLSAFLFHGTGIASQLPTMNHELSTKHTLRPMAARLRNNARDMAQARKNGLRIAVGLPIEESERFYPKASSAGTEKLLEQLYERLSISNQTPWMEHSDKSIVQLINTITKATKNDNVFAMLDYHRFGGRQLGLLRGFRLHYQARKPKHLSEAEKKVAGELLDELIRRLAQILGRPEATQYANGTRRNRKGGNNKISTGIVEQLAKREELEIALKTLGQGQFTRALELLSESSLDTGQQQELASIIESAKRQLSISTGKSKTSSAGFREAQQLLDVYIKNAIKNKRSQLYEFEVYDILRILGINAPQYIIINNPQNIPALPEAKKLVLKIISPSLHKSDEATADGMVRGVEIVFPEQAQQVIRRMFEIQATTGVVVYPFIESASGPSELLVGFTDADSGRLICFGEGGFYTDYRIDRAYRDYNLPFSAKGLVASTNIGKHFIYGRYRSRNLPLRPEELENLIKMLAAFKRYYDDSGEYSVTGFDINPLICLPDGRLFACDGKLEFSIKGPLIKTKNVKRLQKLFHPKSIAVIGASATPFNVNPNIGRLMDNLMRTFTGRGFRDRGTYLFYLKDKYAKAYRGVPFVAEFPYESDLYVVFRSKEKGVGVVKELLARGKAAILIAAAFGEVKEGAELEQRLKEAIEEADEDGSLVGPNTMGIITPDFDATFADESAGLTASEDSNIAFISQSGAFLQAGASSMALRNINIYYGVSIGNAMDLGAADYLEYILEYEPQIKVVAMYLENTGGDRLGYFINEARKKGVSVVIRKGGTTREGEKGVASHTASTAGKFEHFKAVLEQAGAVVFSDTDDYDLWVDSVYTASHFAAKGIPQGKRVFTFTSGGEDAVTTTDVVAGSGELEFPQPDNELSDFISKLNLANTVKNPFDVTAAATTDKIKSIIDYLGSSEQFDLIIFEYLPWLSEPGKVEELAQFIKHRESAKPLVLIIKDDSPAGKELKDDLRRSGFLVFDTPQRGILALSAILKSNTAVTKSSSAGKRVDDFSRNAEALSVIASAA